MKTFIPFLAFCLISFKPSHYEYEQLYLIYESTIIISGETNVGAFNCQSCNTQIDTLTVSYFENDVHSYQIKHPPIELLVKAFDCGSAVITKDFGKLLGLVSLVGRDTASGSSNLPGRLNGSRSEQEER